MTFERNETKNHGGKIMVETAFFPPFIDAVTHTWSFLEGQDSRRR